MTGDIDVNETTSPAGAEARALRQLVEEAREAPPPPIDWGGVEARLMARIEADEASRKTQRAAGPKWSAVVGMAAAAAAVVMLVAGVGGDTSAPDAEPIPPTLAQIEQLVPVPGGSADAPIYALRGLRPHTAVESGAEPMAFTLPGVVDWSLAPHSRVVIESVPSVDSAGRVPHVVRLERGRIEAAVVPRKDSNQLVEAFVVEAGTTRVAVHGTRFTVERHQDLVEVEVTRGTVTVGPARHRGATTGHLLVSPRRASFRAGQLVHSAEIAAAEQSREVATADEDARAPEAASHETPNERPNETSSAAEPVAKTGPGMVVAPSQPQPVEPSQTDEIDDPAKPTATPPLSVAQARSRVVSCLASAAPEGAGQGTKVTVSSQVTAVLGDKGDVLSVQFSPPLRPDLQQRCAGTLFGQKLDATGQVRFPVQVRAE